MKILRAGCLTLLAISVTAYAVFVSLPVERHAKFVDEALVSVAKRHAERLPKLKDPSANGFLARSFVDFWGKGESDGGGVKQAIDAWAGSYSSVGKFKVDHAGLLKAKDPEYLRARNGFKALLPDLVTALEKPIFQPVNEDFAKPTKIVRDYALVQLAMGLTGYAESLVADGKPSQAALVYEMVFRMGRLVSDDVPAVQTMVGVSLQALAFQSLVSSLAANAQLWPAGWSGLSLAVAAATPTSRTLSRVVENDLAFGNSFLQQPRATYDGDAKPLRGIYLVPGFRARDLRVFRNLMGTALEQSKSGVIVMSRPPDSRAAMLQGQNGPGTALLFPDYDKQSARLVLHTAKMTGLSAWAGVCAYRAKYRKLPQTLADLDKMNLQGPGGNRWADLKLLDYTVDGENAAVLVKVHPQAFVNADYDVVSKAPLEARNSSYFRVVKQGFVFTVRKNK